MSIPLPVPPRVAMLPGMIDWSSITPQQWALTDVSLAIELGCTPANVGDARQRHQAPSSPAGHGGSRTGSGRKAAAEGADDQVVSMTLNPTRARKRLYMQAHKAAGGSLNAWALGVLDAEVERLGIRP